MPKVAIIICAYNMERYLGEAIESALAQTHPSVKVVVVDDGSTDKSSTIAKRYEGRVRLLCQSNRGLAGARMTGIRAAAEADYIKVLDADDALHPQCVELEAKVLDALPNVPLVCSNMLNFQDGEAAGRLAWNVGRLLGEGRLLRVLGRPIEAAWQFGAPIWWAVNLFRRRALMEAGGFDESLRHAEDLDLWWRIAACQPMAYLGVPLYARRLRPDSMIGASGSLEKAIPAYEKTLAWIQKERPEYREALVTLVARRASRSYIWQEMCRGNVAEARRVLWESPLVERGPWRVFLKMITLCPPPLCRMVLRWRQRRTLRGDWGQEHPLINLQAWRTTDYRPTVGTAVERHPQSL